MSCSRIVVFSTLVEAGSGIASLTGTTADRPHSALGNITPAEFALKSTLENSPPEARNEPRSPL